MRVLILKWDAPMMSFGTTAIDGQRPTAQFPAKSAVTGFLGNALGWDRDTHASNLQRLQDEMELAVRREGAREGVLLADYQTAVVGDKTALSLREYVCDSQFTLALAGTTPDVDALGEAVQRPKRVLWIGRKSCVPARPVFSAVIEAESALDGLLSVPGTGIVQWTHTHPKYSGLAQCVNNRKRWSDRVHVGQQLVYVGEPSCC